MKMTRAKRPDQDGKVRNETAEAGSAKETMNDAVYCTVHCTKCGRLFGVYLDRFQMRERPLCDICRAAEALRFSE